MLRLLLLATAIGLILWFDIVTPDAVGAALAHPWITLGCLALVLASGQTSVLRWLILLRWQGCDLRFWQVWQISYIGWFAGSFLPGAAGSDLLRVVYVHQAQPDDRMAAYMTIVVDRLLGLAALLLWILLMALPLAGTVRRSPVLGLLVAIAAGSLLALALAMPLAGRLAGWLGHRLSARAGLARHVRDFGNACDLAMRGWRDNPLRLAACLGIGALGHGAIVLAIVLLAWAQTGPLLSWTELGLAGSMALLVNQLPLTPGGIGVGESSFAEICRLLRPEAATLALGSAMFAFRLVTLASYLPGAPALLLYRRGAAAKAASIAASTVSTSTASRPG